MLTSCTDQLQRELWACPEECSLLQTEHSTARRVSEEPHSQTGLRRACKVTALELPSRPV